MKKQVVSVSPKITDDTVIGRLSLKNQIKFLLSRFTDDQAKELDANKKITIASMKRKASLVKFIENATKRLLDKTSESVTVSMSSEYLAYFDEITDTKKGMGRYFNFEILNKESLRNRLPGVRYKVLLKISTKKQGEL